MNYLFFRNNPISPINQVLLTLRLLATGSFYITMGDFIGVSTVTAHRIMSRVTKAIASLRPHYIKFPSTIAEIRREQEQFYAIAGFPKVIGCIDCTHIRIQSFGKFQYTFQVNLDNNYYVFTC